MAEINYDEIKAEYISSDVSLTSLAKKYGIPKATLSRRARKEEWLKIRESARAKAVQKIEEATIETRIDLATRCISIVNKLVEKIERSVEIISAGDITAEKDLVSMVRQLHEMGAFELAPQDDNVITIKFEDGDDDE